MRVIAQQTLNELSEISCYHITELASLSEKGTYKIVGRNAQRTRAVKILSFPFPIHSNVTPPPPPPLLKQIKNI